MIDYDRLLIATGAQANVYSIEGLEETVVFRSLADDALGTSPVTIGPASDGGHYLIGMRAPGVPLFEGVE